jgi:hypothetical protein
MCCVSKSPGSLNILELSGPVQDCVGIPLPLNLLFIVSTTNFGKKF